MFGNRERRRLRRVLLAVIAALFVASIPWYRQTGAVPELVLGLPDWVAVALGCYVAIALLNAWAWLLTDVRDPEPDDGRPTAVDDGRPTAVDDGRPTPSEPPDAAP